MMKSIMLAVLLLFAVNAHGQVGCESDGDGEVLQQKSAVKKIGDAFRVSWAAPTQLADADCTLIASDPAFAITSYEVYVEVGAPAQSGAAFPPLVTVPASQTELSGTLTQPMIRPGSDVYFAVSACNEFGCSNLSEQPWVKIGGPPRRGKNVNVQ